MIQGWTVLNKCFVIGISRYGNPIKRLDQIIFETAFLVNGEKRKKLEQEKVKKVGVSDTISSRSSQRGTFASD